MDAGQKALEAARAAREAANAIFQAVAGGDPWPEALLRAAHKAARDARVAARDADRAGFFDAHDTAVQAAQAIEDRERSDFQEGNEPEGWSY